MGLKTLHYKKTAFPPPGAMRGLKWKSTWQQHSPKPFFPPSVVTVFCLHTGCQHIAITKPYLFSYGECNCLQALAPGSVKVVENVTRPNKPCCHIIFFPLKAEATRWWHWCPLSPDKIDLWLLMCRHGRSRGSTLLRYIMLVTMWLSSSVNVETIWEVVVLVRGPASLAIHQSAL